MVTNLKSMFMGKETKQEEMREARGLKMGTISKKQYVQGEKGEKDKASTKTLMKTASKIKSGKETPAQYAKKGK